MVPWLLLLACSGGEIKADTEDTGVDEALEALTIEIVEPDSGPTTGGTSIRIVGTGFTYDTTSVAIDQEECTQFTYLGETGVACITPAGEPGEAQLVVSRTDDGAKAITTFTYSDGGDDTGASGSDDTGVGSDDTGAAGVDDTGSAGGEDTGPTAAVDYCHLQYPCEMTASASEASEPVYCWVYQAGATPGEGQGAGISVQVGWGADGTDPAGGGWAWTEASYNTDKDGLTPGDLSNDEYEGAFTTPSSAGSYDYACRVSADDGLSWTSCDVGDDNAGGCGAGASGSGDGYLAADAGQLTVE